MCIHCIVTYKVGVSIGFTLMELFSHKMCVCLCGCVLWVHVYTCVNMEVKDCYQVSSNALHLNFLRQDLSESGVYQSARQAAHYDPGDQYMRGSEHGHFSSAGVTAACYHRRFLLYGCRRSELRSWCLQSKCSTPQLHAFE